MRKALIKVNGIDAAIFTEIVYGKSYQVEYLLEYHNNPISLTMPIKQKIYHFDTFPSFFDGLLPEGIQLEGLLRSQKLDRYDYFSQLMCVGKDMVGAVTAEEILS
ncbi:MAG: HipA N-terminal domain-containing protein [Gammaproteobacteria bacterium]|nr:HipA N-terminal domain-containing protein [Gammaproteobacteria bacterium]